MIFLKDLDKKSIMIAMGITAMIALFIQASDVWVVFWMFMIVGLMLGHRGLIGRLAIGLVMVPICVATFPYLWIGTASGLAASHFYYNQV